MDKMDNQELISALADGQLRGAAFGRAVEAAADGPGQRTWQAYHVIGEVLRTGRHVPATAPDRCLERLQQRLQQEAVARPALAIEPPRRPAAHAANDWGWKVAAGVASVAAVAAIGWNLVASGPAAGPQLAAAPAAGVPAAVQPAAMIRDPRLDQLLAAHRQLGGATALQAPSGFLRNATFEGPAR